MIGARGRLGFVHGGLSTNLTIGPIDWGAVQQNGCGRHTVSPWTSGTGHPASRRERFERGARELLLNAIFLGTTMRVRAIRTCRQRAGLAPDRFLEESQVKFNPGPWSEPLLEGAAAGTAGVEHTLGAYGEETAARVMEMAQEWVSRFTVVIATARTAANTKSATDIAPGSGVVVRLDGDVYGVLTAAHVLRRGDNTE